MSNDAAVLDKNPIAPGSTVGQVQPQNPVGTLGSKERGPINLAGPEIQHNLTPEVTDSGVKENQDRPNLTDEHFKAGIKVSVPVPSVSTNTVTLPMSEEEIDKKLKTGQDDDSEKWLAGLIKKIIKVMGL
jgi:hypothetical protein